MIGWMLLLLSSLTFALDVPVFDAVYPGKGYNCGQTSDAIYCWGKNDYQTAIIQDGLSNIKLVQLEERFGCVLDEIGMNCWGAEAPILSPEMVESENISSFETSNNSVCAIIDSRINCVGAPAVMDYPKNLSKVTSIGINHFMGCAVQEGKLFCWGDRSRDNSYKLFNIPENLGEVIQVSVSQDTVCTLNSNSEAICWGYQNDGKSMKIPFKVDSMVAANYSTCFLGENKVYCTRYAPNLPTDFGPIIHMAGQDDGAFCLTNEKKAFHCWGGYAAGQLPPLVKHPLMMAADEKGTYFVNKEGELFGAGQNRTVKSTITKNLHFLSAKYGNICYIDEAGPQCLGSDIYGETSIPNDLEEVTALVPGDETICAITKEEKVRCWGNGRFGRANPPKNLSGVQKLVGGQYHFCSLNRANEIQCWGWEIKVPQFDPSLKVLDLTAGDRFACALFDDQSLQCWGDKMPTNMIPPTHLYGLKGLISGSAFACGYSDTEVNCWGDSTDGKLQTPKVSGEIQFITAGNAHACFMDNEGVKCWGKNTEGQYQFFTK